MVGDDTDRVSIQVPETGDQCRTVALLELVEATAVEHAGEHGLHVEGLLGVHGRDDAVQLMRREEGLFC